MKVKKRNSKSITFYIKHTLHNTFFSLFKNTTVIRNNTIKPSYCLLKIYSCGSFGFKNKKKETSFAINILATKSIEYALENNYKYAHIIFKGISTSKKNILNTFLHTVYNHASLTVLSVSDLTSFSYNGCRSKKMKKR